MAFSILAKILALRPGSAVEQVAAVGAQGDIPGQLPPGDQDEKERKEIGIYSFIIYIRSTTFSQ